jgi:hemolysin activation/secretion protein
MERGESLAGAPGPAVDQRRLRRSLAGRAFWPLAALGLIGLCSGSPVLAQITPSQSLQQRLQEDQLRLRLIEFEDDDAVDDSAPLIQSAPQSPLPWSGSLELRKLELQSTLPEMQALEQSLQGWIGRRIEAEQLRQIQKHIEAWFWQRDQVVGIYRIAAEPGSGALTLAIAPLILAAVTVEPGSAHQFNNALAINVVTAAVPLGTALRPGKLESALLKLNDRWGVQVRGRLQSGADADARILVLELSDLNRQSLLLEIDNALNRYVGTVRTLATLSSANTLGRGERFWITPSWWGSGQGTGTAPVQLGIDWPVGLGGLLFSASANAGRYGLFNTGAVLYTGETAGVSLSLQQPLWRRDTRSLWLRLSSEGFHFSDERNRLNLDDKQGGVLRASLVSNSSDQFMGQGNTTLVLGGSFGAINLNRNSAFKQFDQLTSRIQGSYGAINLSLLRQQVFRPNWSASWLLLGQMAANNLSGYEQCGMGWPNGVRAYPPGENSSSSCLVSQLDLIWSWRPWLKLVGFADVGWGERWRQPFPGSLQPNSYRLAGAGLGIDVGRVSRWLVSLRAAFPIGGNPAQSSLIDLEARSPSPRVWAGLQLWL